MVLGDGVQLAGADPGPDGGLHRRDRAGGHEPGGAHELDLVRRLDLDHASTPLREQREPGQDARRHRRPALRRAAQPASGCPASVGAQRLHGAGRDLLDLTDRVDAGEQALGLVEARRAARSVPGRPPGGAGRSRACRRRAAPSGRRRASGGRRAGGPARPRRRRARARGRGPGRGRPARTRSCSAWAMVRGKPSSRKPGLGVGLGQPVLDHGDGDLVGDEVTGVHVGLGLPAQLGLPAHVGAEDVAGGDRRDAEPPGDDLRLGALARSGGAQQDDAHYFRNPS